MPEPPTMPPPPSINSTLPIPPHGSPQSHSGHHHALKAPAGHHTGQPPFTISIPPKTPSSPQTLCFNIWGGGWRGCSLPLSFMRAENEPKRTQNAIVGRVPPCSCRLPSQPGIFQMSDERLGGLRGLRGDGGGM